MIDYYKIPIDFVPGTHGNYLETVCNKGFGIVDQEENFSSNGSSHKKSDYYLKNKIFDAKHWFEGAHDELYQYPLVISIQFNQNDLLLLSAVSLLRAGDCNIDTNELENDSFAKLEKFYKQNIIEKIVAAYPDVDYGPGHIPRYILREFFKFGFKDPNSNGYWINQECMKYCKDQQVIVFDFASFYNVALFVKQLQTVADAVESEFNFDNCFYETHQKFLDYNPFLNIKSQCDLIVDAVVEQSEVDIPRLNLLQESYINAALENIFRKEMPFHQENYFKSTKDMLYYLNNQAPLL
jgi:hypothetical protein